MLLNGKFPQSVNAEVIVQKAIFFSVHIERFFEYSCWFSGDSMCFLYNIIHLLGYYKDDKVTKYVFCVESSTNE